MKSVKHLRETVVLAFDKDYSPEYRREILKGDRVSHAAMAVMEAMGCTVPKPEQVLADFLGPVLLYAAALQQQRYETARAQGGEE